MKYIKKLLKKLLNKNKVIEITERNHSVPSEFNDTFKPSKGVKIYPRELKCFPKYVILYL